MIDRQEIKFEVDRHLHEAGNAMFPRAREVFDGLLQQRGLGGPDPTSYFEPLGHPLFELPVWVAERLGAEGVPTPRETLAKVLGVSAVGYLHVRAQDNWLDAPSREDPTLIALAEALMATSNRLLVSIVGSSDRFWDFYVEVFSDYAESLILTDEIRRSATGVSRPTFERLLAQARPLVIPSAALLDRADRWELRPYLEDFVLAATAATQLFNDLTDIFKDRKMGHRTWTIEAVGDEAADRLWTEVVSAPGGRERGRLQEVLDEALGFHSRSAEALRLLVLAHAENWLVERKAAIVALPDLFRRHMLEIFIHRMRPSTSDERG